MKFIFCALVLGFTASANAAPDDSFAGEVFSCYRTAIYHFAKIESRDVRVGSFDIFFMMRTTSYSTENIPVVRKDLVLGLIDFIDQLNHRDPRTPFDFGAALRECRDMAKKSDASKEEMLLYAPNYLLSPEKGLQTIVYKNEKYLGLHDKQQKLIQSLLRRSYECTGINGKLFGGMAVVAGAELAGYRCKGWGGLKWYSVAPAGFLGIGGGTAGGIGFRIKSEEYDGWYKWADLRFVGLAGASYFAGASFEAGKGEPLDGDTWWKGFGILLGTGVFSTMGADLMIPVPYTTGEDLRLLWDTLMNPSQHSGFTLN